MARSALNHRKIQRLLFAKYHSLDLRKKLYQVKASRWASKLAAGKKGTIRLLEIGCADGSFAAYVGRKIGAMTYGVDVAGEAIQQAKRVLHQATTHNAEERLPYAAKTFDLVIALEIIEHLYDTDFFLSEVRRVLKPGGHVILSTPNLASARNRYRLLVNQYPQYLEYSTRGAGHIHLYTAPVLVAQLAQHGLRVNKIMGANIPAPGITHLRAPNFYRELMMRAGDWWVSLGSHLIVVAS